MSKAIVFVAVLVSGVLLYAMKTYEPIALHAVKAYEYAKFCNEGKEGRAMGVILSCLATEGPPLWDPPPPHAYGELGHGEQIRADLQVDWLKTRLTKADECLRDELIACEAASLATPRTDDERGCSDRALAKHKRRTNAQKAAFTNTTGLPLPPDESHGELTAEIRAMDCATYFHENGMFDDLVPDTPKPGMFDDLMPPEPKPKPKPKR